MGLVANKLARLVEYSNVIVRCSADMASRYEITKCYANLGRAVSDPTEFRLRLRVGRSVVPCQMRRSDVFTLIEVFHEQQYRVRTELPQSPTIIDAGANIGLASLWLLGHYPSAALHAFEPEKRNYELLQMNVGGRASARVNRLALGNLDGEVALTLSHHGAMHSTADPTVGSSTVRVPGITLKSYLAQREIRAVDLLKLDVEGGELEVLEGLGERIRDVHVVVGEVHERVVAPRLFFQRIAEWGFDLVHTNIFKGGEGRGVLGFEARRA